MFTHQLMTDAETPFGRMRALFDVAAELPIAARVAFVRHEARGDSALGDEVLSLLGALENSRAPLDGPSGELLAAALGESHDVTHVGQRVGAYDIVRLVGYGGMGAVYEGARVGDDFNQRVAVKFLRPGLDSELAIRRFRHERQILASLNHRNIAGLFDGGLTAAGSPYFVMEYVDGVPITRYCDQGRLSIRQRVMLFRQVCAAVQHAHQQFVVHRDLKPGNILVTPDGTVKLLDFGIAKLMREEVAPDELPLTQGANRAYTPEYASPEQVRGLPIAAASDTYSLGVVLYELLCGTRPYSTHGLLINELEELICNAPITRPSGLVTAASADHRGERHVQRLRAQLIGDLDAVVLTALAKEPGRRYATVEQLNQDLRRWLDGHAVTAHPPSLQYRTRKFLSRYRVEVTAVVVTFSALIGGIISTARQARRTETEQQKTTQVNRFLTTMLSSADPGALGKDVTVAQVLSQAASDISKQSLDSEVEAELRHAIGQTYYGLGYYDSASVHVQRAYDLRRARYGLIDARTALSLSFVVAVAEARGEFAPAESLAKVAVDIQRKLPTVNSGELGRALDNLGRIVEAVGRLDEAMSIKREALHHSRLATDSVGRNALPSLLNNMAVSHDYRGEYAAAESLQREALLIESALHGTTSANYGDLLRGLSSVYDNQLRYAEADSVLAVGIGIMRATFGPDHPTFLRAMSSRARILLRLKRYDESAAIAQQVVARIGGPLLEGDPTSTAVLHVLGAALDSLRRYADAEPPLKRALEIRRRLLTAGDWSIGSAEAVLGAHYVEAKQFAQAEPLLLSGYRSVAAERGDTSQVSLAIANRLVLLYERSGRLAQATAWRAKAGLK